MNQVDGLHKVIKYVKAEFLLKILKLNPEAEFNIKRLSKNMICEFIDSGYKQANDSKECCDGYEGEDALNLRISMKKARIILPLLEEHGPVHITDGRWGNPIREDIPDEIFSGIFEMCGFIRELWEGGYYKKSYNMVIVRDGLEDVTDYYEDKDKKWMWKINKKGTKLLEWFQGG